MSLKIVVVGGVAGGAGAAAKARRVNEEADIVMFERGPHVSFANCGLPYFIGGDIAEKRSLLLQTPESFWKRYRVRTHVNHEVLRIDRAGRRVEVKDIKNGRIFWEPYDRLVLAPGAAPVVPAVPGSGASNVFTVRTVPDAESLRGFVEGQKPKRAVVAGAGFIGLETAEALHKRGLAVTVVEKLSQVLPPLDGDMAGYVSRHLEAKGLDVVLSDGFSAFLGEERSAEVVLESGRRLEADMVVLSLGVRPELTLAREAGLAIGEAGGIVVNDHLQTSDPAIYAAGDAVEVTQLVTGKKTRMPLGGPANKQGRVAGANAAGGNLVFPGALGTSILEVLGLSAAKTGLSEREAREEGLDVSATLIHALHHAGYYPGGKPLHLKLVWEKSSGRLLGAQAMGESGVDKRIDVLATALMAHFKVKDLEDLDLAYAPPFSSAKDPVVMAGFVAANAWRGECATLTGGELSAKMRAGETFQLVDVRTPREYGQGSLRGAINIPVDEVRERRAELDPARDIVVYCRSGYRGYLAARVLLLAGFKNVRNLTGGILGAPQEVLGEPPVS